MLLLYFNARDALGEIQLHMWFWDQTQYCAFLDQVPQSHLDILAIGAVFPMYRMSFYLLVCDISCNRVTTFHLCSTMSTCFSPATSNIQYCTIIPRFTIGSLVPDNSGKKHVKEQSNVCQELLYKIVNYMKTSYVMLINHSAVCNLLLLWYNVEFKNLLGDCVFVYDQENPVCEHQCSQGVELYFGGCYLPAFINSAFGGG